MKKSIILFLLLGLLTNSCGANPESELKETQKEPSTNNSEALQKSPPIPYVLVFVDLSKTMDSLGVALVAQKAAAIFSSLPEKSVMVIKDVNGHPEAESIAKLQVPAPAKPIPSEVKKAKQRSAILAAQIVELIKFFFDEHPQGDNNKSCMLSSLEEAYYHLIDPSQKGQYEFHLVYLSDMVEQCPGSSSGIDIYNAERKKLEELAQKAKQKLADTGLDLRALVGNRIHVVFTSSGAVMNSDGLSLSDVRTFWRTAFTGLGYSEDEVNNHFNLKSELPSIFQGKAGSNFATEKEQ